MSSERVEVAPEVLTWARRSISLDVEAAAKRLGVSVATLEGWESGHKSPTLPQLRTAAAKYKRPLAVLLLADPPTDFDAMRDFRRGGEASEWSTALHGEFRRAIEQREVILELSETSPGSVADQQPLPSISLSDDPEDAGAIVRDFLGITLSDQLGWIDQYEAINAWIAAAESRGVVVIHTAGVAMREMRGFAISESPYPVVALNGSDFPRGRVFTLLHELTHIAINLGGLCDLHEVERKAIRNPDDQLEHFCNQVAAAALMPADSLLGEPSVRTATSSSPWPLADLAIVSRRFGVSSESLLLRLITLDRASWAIYWERREQLAVEYERVRDERRRRSRESGGGGSFYRTKARNLGHGYAQSVLDAFSSRALSSLEVADSLGIKFNQLQKLEHELR